MVCLLFSRLDQADVSYRLVSASHTSQLPPGALSAIFGSATLVNGFVAVISGVSSNWAVEQTGTAKTPFFVAVVVLGFAAAAIRSAWSENYGQQSGNESVHAGFISAWHAISGSAFIPPHAMSCSDSQ